MHRRKEGEGALGSLKPLPRRPEIRAGFARLGFSDGLRHSPVELGNLLEPLPIVDDQGLALLGDQLLAPQALKGAVHMHRGEPEGIGQFCLGDRQLKAVVPCQAD